MGHYILTASGKQFDLESPTVDMVDINDIAAALSKICRFTGHTQKFYSVAQHSTLAVHLVNAAGLHEFALEALLHDAAEAYVGDVSTPLKRVLGDAYHRVEHRVDAVIRRRFGLPPVMSPAVKHADIQCLGVERARLMPADSVVWPALQGVQVPHVPIYPLFPDAARDNFLTVFNLSGGK